MNGRSGLGIMAAALALALGGGCDDGGTAPPPGGDSGVRMDGAAGGDGGMDAGPIPDGGALPEAGPDGFVIVLPDGDIPIPDGFFSFDALPDPDEDSGVGRTCTVGSCPAGTLCLGDGAGGSTCQPSGHPCGSGADCPGGSTCLPSGVCDHGAPLSCGDSRDCPLGYACEGGSCANRRIACDMDVQLCPYGFYCLFPSYTAVGFCQKNTHRCDSDAACLGSWECVDATGSSTLQCMPAAGCDTNAACSGDTPVCEVSPRGNAGCGDRGPCASAADCDTGLECVDLWGDGLSECVPAGGSCGSVTDCAGPQICGSEGAADPPGCIGSGREF